MPQIPISLAYAQDSQTHHYLEIQVEQGTTLWQALTQANWIAKFPEIDQWYQTQQIQPDQKPTKTQWHIGIFSKKQPPNYILQPHDRIEIYRDLQINPMQKRQKRATQNPIKTIKRLN